MEAKQGDTEKRDKLLSHRYFSKFGEVKLMLLQFFLQIKQVFELR